MDSRTSRTSRKLPADDVEAEIARIRALDKEALRTEWRATFKKPVPKALTKDLLARMLIWEMQARIFGGHDKATLKLLDSYARGKPNESDRLRRLKAGTELVREYQGKRHIVTVVPDGFMWEGNVYRSLTTIAKEITGTNWNGPRFFGLRQTDPKPSSAPSRSSSAKGKGDAGRPGQL
ncbi:DUF2924 domain-containing protein [Pyruvatibacter sp.]|uniref:DUF2924 domain-containing protein n=1 Tax=Pyruvatibacter sp. TaxID=1981328 RepID=UPI0032EABDFF